LVHSRWREWLRVGNEGSLYAEMLMKSTKHSYDVAKSVRSPKNRNDLVGTGALMPVYRVGEPLDHGRWSWPEGAQFSSSPSGYELTLLRSAIDSQVAADVTRGEAEFAVIVDLPLIVLAYRFGESISWSEVPYCWHLQPARGRVVPPLEGSSEARALLWITLVSARDGIIKAQRGLTLSPDFTRALNATVRAQAMMQFDSQECAAAISRIYLPHTLPANRSSSAIARTKGNE
jgi:hypothetical protein